MSLLWWRISMRHLGPRECNVMTSRDLMTSHSWGVTSRCDGSWERVTSHVHVVMEKFFRFTSLWVYVTYVDREGLMCLFFPWLTAWIAEAKFKAAFWGLMSLFVTGVFIKFMVFIEASYYFGWKIKFSFHLPFLSWEWPESDIWDICRVWSKQGTVRFYLIFVTHGFVEFCIHLFYHLHWRGTKKCLPFCNRTIFPAILYFPRNLIFT